MSMIDMIPSLISGVIALITCILTNNAQLKKRDIEQDKQMMELQATLQQNVAVIGCKIDELDRKQAVHNSVIERVYHLEERASVMEERIRENKGVH